MPLCKRVHYWGAVQGVGFRMTTKRIAGQYAVTGYVRNLPDGQVEVVVAGEKGEIDGFLGAVATRMAPFVEGHRIVDTSEQLSSFTNFDIRI
jgi:acylphosphatase